MALPRNDTATSGPRAVEAAAAGPGPCRFELPARGESVSEARRRLRAYLRAHGCDDDSCETAALLVSELATNAVRHTSSSTFICRISLHDGRISLEVEDHGGTPAQPSRREPGPCDVDGRGLLLVDALSEEWDVTPGRHGGRVVRAVLRGQD